MPNQGKRISDDIRWAVVRMVTIGCRVDFIERTLDVSERSIRSIMQIYNTSGGHRVSLDIEDPALGRGRPQLLSYREIWVSFSFLSLSLRGEHG